MQMKHLLCLLVLSSANLTICNASLPSSEATSEAFEPFTGKVLRNKVRLRLNPGLDGAIYKELNKGDLISVVGETEDFYAISPPEGTRAYIYRTFVLDNTIEGSKVNVRTEPHLEAPVIAQLHTGDKVEGSINPQNTKWFEIAAPDTARFYVAKEYIENIGDPATLALLQKRLRDANALLSETQQSVQSELSKEFPDIRVEALIVGYTHIIREYPELEEQTARAKELLTQAQETYLHKKTAFLEHSHKTQAERPTSHAHAPTPPQPLTTVAIEPSSVPYYEEKPISINTPEPIKHSFDSQTHTQSPIQFQASPPQTKWSSIEKAIYDKWAAENPDSFENEYYQQELHQAVTLRGYMDAYVHPVKNKPGDYVILNPTTRSPIAIIYSTDIDLQHYVGQEVTAVGVARPNNHFAFKAYKVIAIE